MKRILSLLLAAALLSLSLLTLAACTKEPEQPSYTPGSLVKLQIENADRSIRGDIYIRLYPEVAPITVANFEKLVKQGFYDGLTFHRVDPGFMIQGGAPLGNGMGGSPDKIKGEFYYNGVNNPLSHIRGVVSMARSKSYNSASSQFFIVHEDSTSLDGQYAAFGMVERGIAVVDAIAQTKTNGSERPVATVTIVKATIVEE